MRQSRTLSLRPRPGVAAVRTRAHRPRDSNMPPPRESFRGWLS
nr:MAG TPA: hypothetical protein [Caudoviricetes sp.]